MGIGKSQVPSVELPRSLAEEFKRAAKAAFPREEYGILLGKATRDGIVRPSRLYIPPDTAIFCGESWVSMQDHWWKDAKKLAKAEGLSLLGDLHSHPYPAEYVPDKTAGPSAQDLDGCWYLTKKTRRKNPIFGICSVYPTGRGLDCTFRFWNAVPSPELYLVDL